MDRTVKVDKTTIYNNIKSAPIVDIEHAKKKCKGLRFFSLSSLVLLLFRLCFVYFIGGVKEINKRTEGENDS